MPQQYTVKDNTTGKTITFVWNAPEPPTDADFEEVFASARQQSETPEHPHARVARMVGENLPAVGGAIGGVLGAAGGPAVAAGLAGLGGAGGRLLQRAIGAEGMDVQDVAQEGAMQGGIQAVGGLAGKAMGAIGSRLYRGLAKPSKALQAEHPDAVDTALNARALITGGGGRKLGNLMSQSAQQADDMIAQAAPNVRNVRSRELVSEFGNTVKELRKRADIGQPSQLAEVGARGRRLMRSEPVGGFDLVRAQQLKKTAQNAANAGYRQAERGTVKEVTADTMLDKDVARGFRKAIEKRVPEVGPVNKRTQSLGGAKDLVEDAVERDSKTLAFGGAKDFLAAMGGGATYGISGDPQTAAGVGLATRLLATPSTGSAVAILLNELMKKQAAQNALRALMSSHDQE